MERSTDTLTEEEIKAALYGDGNDELCVRVAAALDRQDPLVFKVIEERQLLTRGIFSPQTKDGNIPR
jgi:hypothetical protein